jgi:hypothetical protein
MKSDMQRKFEAVKNIVKKSFGDMHMYVANVAYIGDNAPKGQYSRSVEVDVRCVVNASVLSRLNEAFLVKDYSISVVGSNMRVTLFGVTFPWEL